jgi:hypothetical protein
MEGIISAYKAIYRDMQKAMQYKFTSFFTEPSVSAVLRRYIIVATFSHENRPPLFHWVTI